MRGMIFPVVAVLTIGVIAGAIAAPVQKPTVTMTEFQFAPKTLALKPGTAVELTVVNKGAIQHEFMLYPIPGSMGMEMDMDAYGAENTYFKNIGTVEVVSGGKTSRSSGSSG